MKKIKWIWLVSLIILFCAIILRSLYLYYDNTASELPEFIRGGWHGTFLEVDSTTGATEINEFYLEFSTPNILIIKIRSQSSIYYPYRVSTFNFLTKDIVHIQLLRGIGVEIKLIKNGEFLVVQPVNESDTQTLNYSTHIGRYSRIFVIDWFYVALFLGIAWLGLVYFYLLRPDSKPKTIKFEVEQKSGFLNSSHEWVNNLLKFSLFGVGWFFAIKYWMVLIYPYCTFPWGQMIIIESGAIFLFVRIKIKLRNELGSGHQFFSIASFLTSGEFLLLGAGSSCILIGILAWVFMYLD